LTFLTFEQSYSFNLSITNYFQPGVQLLLRPPSS